MDILKDVKRLFQNQAGLELNEVDDIIVVVGDDFYRVNNGNLIDDNDLYLRSLESHTLFNNMTYCKLKNIDGVEYGIVYSESLD